MEVGVGVGAAGAVGGAEQEIKEAETNPARRIRPENNAIIFFIYKSFHVGGRPIKALEPEAIVRVRNLCSNVIN